MDDGDVLTSAFKDQDAVISAALEPITVENQKTWIDAAISAGVKRIFPSEYSTNLESPLAEGLPALTGKKLVLSAGGLGPNFRTKMARYHNGGHNLIGATRLSDVAEAIAKILRNEKGLYAEAGNKPVYIHSAAITEKQMTKIAEKVVGLPFAVEYYDVEEIYQNAKFRLAMGDMSALMQFYYQMMYGKGYGGSESFQEMSWNDKVGLKTMTETELEDLVRNIVQKNGAK
ncbi:hypothetical protein CSUB01_12103 [Colletotrichum sublineola]|uniref:NmrA-like domain-containing protein n=1 Tax=Colletotrichum sublineola TaxID=1173701 RepID=A0A066XYA2_COLSU|nr:hypothetical protein CSUB01_12103 [Colletotrichum sublineola]